MEASMQHRPQERTFGMVMREVDKDLALFLEMRNRENEKKDLFLNEKVDRVDDLTEIKCDEFLANGIEDESDFNWLLSGRDTPRCVPLNEKNDNPNSPALTSRSSRTTSSEDSAPLRSKSKQPAKPANIKPSDRNKRPTSSGGRSVPSRPATPTTRPSLPVMSKPSRSSTPTSRGTGPSSKTLAPAVRSSTPSTRSSVSRSATPTPSATSSTLPTTKSKSRSATPTSTVRSSSRSATPTYKSNSTLPTILKSSVPSRAASPTVKSRPSKQSEMPITSATKRPNSASRVRPTASNSCTLMEASSTGNFRQQSSSPSRVRSSNMNSRSTGPGMLSRSYNYGSGGDDDVNPVLIGTQMVERVVNMRKLAPPKQAEPLFDVKKSSNSQGNSGFGRSLSKKSLDMAIRHMDLTRSVAGDIRLSKVSTSASSFNVRNGPALSKTSTASKSELPTRSNARSEPNLSANTQGLIERPIDKGVAYNDRLSVPPDFQQDQ